MVMQIYHSLFKDIAKSGIVMTDDIFPVKKSAVYSLHNILCSKVRSRKQIFTQIGSKIMPSQQVVISANRLTIPINTTKVTAGVAVLLPKNLSIILSS